MDKVLRKDSKIYYYFENGEKINGAPSDVCGDLTGIRGDLSGISGDLTGIRGDLSGIRGDLSGISGNLSGIRGDLSGVRGNLSGVRGYLDEAHITDAERKVGSHIVKVGNNSPEIINTAANGKRIFELQQQIIETYRETICILEAKIKLLEGKGN